MLEFGAVVETLIPGASDVDAAVTVAGCDYDTWLVISCRIHFCCSGVKPLEPLSEADDRAIAFSYSAASTSGETMKRDTRNIVLNRVAAACRCR